MSDDDRDYFRQRAEAEIEAARAAGHPGAARAHYLLAGYYLDLAHNPLAAGGPGKAGPGYDWADGAAVTGGAAFA
jgi:hypothetical protein